MQFGTARRWAVCNVVVVRHHSMLGRSLPPLKSRRVGPSLVSLGVECVQNAFRFPAVQGKRTAHNQYYIGNTMSNPMQARDLLPEDCLWRYLMAFRGTSTSGSSASALALAAILVLNRVGSFLCCIYLVAVLSSPLPGPTRGLTRGTLYANIISCRFV